MKKIIIISMFTMFCFGGVAFAKSEEPVLTSSPIIKDGYITHTENLKTLSVLTYYMGVQDKKIETQQTYIDSVRSQINIIRAILTGILIFLFTEILFILFIFKKANQYENL